MKAFFSRLSEDVRLHFSYHRAAAHGVDSFQPVVIDAKTPVRFAKHAGSVLDLARNKRLNLKNRSVVSHTSQLLFGPPPFWLYAASLCALTCIYATQPAVPRGDPGGRPGGHGGDIPAARR